MSNATTTTITTMTTTTTTITTTTTEIDANINDILREVIAFLECLRDAQLPLPMESLREKLLKRSKNTLRFMLTRSSPEPYLDMNSGPKTILLTTTEADTEEYVGIEESPQKQNHQDYYETFEHENQPKLTAPIATGHAETQRARDEGSNKEDSETLINIYKNLAAFQSKSSCHKCGPLHRKEGKKLFMPESRACWISLVGSYLLIYRNDRASRPYSIYPIRGYMARSAPNMMPNDRQKSESAFEICCPGSETLQFIARTPKDMDQWIAKFCEIGGGSEGTNNDEGEMDRGNKSNVSNKSPVKLREKATTSQHRNAKSSKKEAGKDTVKNPPPLPARIPRRLPSVPSEDSVPSYKPIECYDDDDDIYYKIDDLKNGKAYQNVKVAKRQDANVSDKQHEVATGHDDDIDASKGRKEGQAQEEKSDTISVEEDMYDDISVLTRIKTSTEEENPKNGDRPVSADDGEESFYDDVENLVGKSINDHVNNQTEAPTTFLQKKSFLERVWSKMESSGKTDKRLRGKVSLSPTPTSSATEAMPTYDDVSELMQNHELLTNNSEEGLSNYNYPPPPRPVFTLPPLIVNHVDPNAVEELYDDVNACREQYNNNQQTILQSTQESGVSAEKCKNATELTANENPLETEHYQSPKSDLRVDDAPEYLNEELYDDITLCANFRARQRDLNDKKDSEDGKLTAGSSDKKSWNRFSVNKKLRSGEPVSLAETNKRNANECEEIDDSTEANGTSKRNTFQRLISKMENSLVVRKVSVRSSSSLPMSKPSTASNNS